jgi:hypothetical protein
MTLEKLGAGIDFVQDATPPASDAIDGDVYLDTSLSPPEVKVFDASTGSFVRSQTAQNLDASVSSAGGINFNSRIFNLNAGATVSLPDGVFYLVPNGSTTVNDGSGVIFEGRSEGGGNVVQYKRTDSTGADHFGPAAFRGDTARVKNNTGSNSIDFGIIGFQQ